MDQSTTAPKLGLLLEGLSHLHDLQYKANSLSIDCDTYEFSYICDHVYSAFESMSQSLSTSSNASVFLVRGSDRLDYMLKSNSELIYSLLRQIYSEFSSQAISFSFLALYEEGLVDLLTEAPVFTKLANEPVIAFEDISKILDKGYALLQKKILYGNVLFKIDTYFIISVGSRTITITDTSPEKLSMYMNASYDFALAWLIPSSIEDLKKALGKVYPVYDKLEIIELRSENRVLKEELERFKNDYFRQIDQQISSLESSTVPSAQNLGNVNKMNERIKQLEEENLEIISSMNLCNLNEDNKTLREELQQAFDTIKELRSFKEKATEDLSISLTLCEQLQSQVTVLNNTLDTKEEEIQMLRKNAPSKEGSNFWKNRAELLFEQTKDLEERISLIEEEKIKANQDLLQISQELETNRSQVQQINSENDLMKNSYQQMILENRSLNNELNTLKQENSEHLKLIKAANSNLSHLTYEIKALKQELFTKSNIEEDMNREINQLNSELLERNSELLALKHAIKSNKKAKNADKENERRSKLHDKGKIARQEEEIYNLQNGLLTIADHIFSLPSIKFNPKKDNLIESVITAIDTLNKHTLK